jgi:hypothetical protein
LASTLEKIRRLEQYLSVSSSAIDPVLDMTVDKLLLREIAHTKKLKERLQKELLEFERKHKMESVKFYKRFNSGELGDYMDFIEWAATVEMLENADKRLEVLNLGREA